MLWNQCTYEWYNCHGHKNNQDYKIFLPKMKRKACLFPNLDNETKKMKTSTQRMWNKIPMTFYYKE
jgi:hypothetical protein